MFIYTAQALVGAWLVAASESAGLVPRLEPGGPSQRDREAVFRDACIRQVRGNHVGIKREIQAGSRGLSRPAARGTHRMAGSKRRCESSNCMGARRESSCGRRTCASRAVRSYDRHDGRPTGSCRLRIACRERIRLFLPPRACLLRCISYRVVTKKAEFA